MSGQLLSHVRYPSEMFQVAALDPLGLYHVTESGAFYSREDAWRTPNDPVSAGAGSWPSPPVLPDPVPGQGARSHVLDLLDYVPNQRGEGSRDVLTGYLSANANAGSVDGKPSEDYGKLKLLTLPKGDTIPGRGQVQNSFTTDPEVTRLLNLLRQGESKVISGNLLTLPVCGGLLYVQPVCVQATKGTSYPVLQKVLVSFGDEIAFEDTLDQALDTLFGGDSGAAAGDNEVPTEGGGTTEGETPPVEVPDTGEGGGDKPETKPTPAPGGDGSASNADLQALKQALDAREAAMKKGDMVAFAAADEALQKAIAKVLGE